MSKLLWGYVFMMVQGVLDFLAFLPLEEDIRYFERKNSSQIVVVTNKRSFVCDVRDMERFVESVRGTDYSIF